MKNFLILILVAIAVLSCDSGQNDPLKDHLELNSPDNTITLKTFINENGEILYSLTHNTVTKVSDSRLGLITTTDSLTKNWKLVDSRISSHKSQWHPVLGRLDTVNCEYSELALKLQKEDNNQKQITIRYRLFNDGLGFRYEIDSWDALDSLYITDEFTEFNIAEDVDALWARSHYKQYQKPYNKTKVSGIDSAHTPVTFQFTDRSLMAIHQASLWDYADMKLNRLNKTTLKSKLVPWRNGNAVNAKLPLITPWRTIQVADDTQELLSSYLIENLNEKSKIDNTNWIKPYKYMGIWWEMHIGTHEWNYGERHGATTERTKELIDFASENNIDAIVVEGWNIKNSIFDEDPANPTFSYLEATPDFDLEEVVNYSKNKNVDFIIHNETIGAIPTLEKEIDSAFAYYNKLGITGVKTGYSGRLPNDEWRHGQFMNIHHQKVIEAARKHKIMLNVHEPIIPTGWDRTYPFYVTSEAVRGSEVEAWSEGNPIGHPVHLAYTRLLAGAMDYTPGIFDIRLQRFADNKKIWHPRDDGTPKRIHTTLAAQLALYVVLYSPWQMVADLPQNYEGNKAFNFIKEVPTVWSDIKVLSDNFGEHIVIARKNKKNWYVGGVNGENKTTVSLDLSFLDDNKEYLMTIYSDSEETNYEDSPEKYSIQERTVTANENLSITMEKGGGFAISIILSNKQITSIQ
ncbi:glycoside hydrolase family 97 protein [Marinigracilibium pacificum]|uniref:Glycoside hydrolase family 97 protein n=1 Tax=Marinigracilibium pacificum TaxID=2729599 RepID=A0A848J5D7_9BACT|nr:glycoside hydrolase family 97 protein [Marinigracilibium pacificum]NMM48362.1 glycoside hydrolase family 97 protein [Marinigracilibium pacificum]